MDKTWISRQGHFLGLIILCIYLVGCNRLQPTETSTAIQRNVTDPNSALLGVLMTDSDFLENWNWTDKSIRQGAELPTADNHHLIESALSGYAGDYGGANGPHISIWHILKRYEQQSPSITPADLASESSSTKEVLTLTFNQVGQSLVSECLRDNTNSKFDSTICTIVVKYNFLNSYLVIGAPADVSPQTLQTIIDRILSGIDNRVRKIGE